MSRKVGFSQEYLQRGINEGDKGGGGGGGSRSRFTENKTVLSQFTKNKIGISRFTEKKRESLKVTYRYILKNYVQRKAFLVVVTFRPLRVLRDAKRKPSSSFCRSRIAPSSSTAKSSQSLSEESSSYSES